MDINQIWRICTQSPNVDSQHPFVRIGARVGRVRDPLQIEMGLKGCLGELVERDVRAVRRGVYEPHSLQVTPICLLQSLIAVLRVLNRATLLVGEELDGPPSGL